MKGIFFIAVMSVCLSLSVSVTFASDSEIQVEGTNVKTLHAEHVFDANVTIGGLLNIGKSKYGERRIIPITGGKFKGPDIEGVVVPGAGHRCLEGALHTGCNQTE